MIVCKANDYFFQELFPTEGPSLLFYPFWLRTRTSASRLFLLSLEMRIYQAEYTLYSIAAGSNVDVYFSILRTKDLSS